MNMTIERVIDELRGQFSEHPPNGWLLGWDEERHLALVEKTCAPYAVTNTTSFDYAFCNRYEVRLDDTNSSGFWVLTVRLSFIMPVFSLHWTRYESQTEGAVITRVPGEHHEVEERLRKALESVGLDELPNEWSEREVGGLELELSGDTNVTVSKCLFEDYAG
jgi:hypothetical protein